MKKVPLNKNVESIKKHNFQIEIFKEINKNKIGKNIMVSPLSIYHILSLTANGSANQTMVEMLQTLGHVNKIELNKENNTISNIVVKLKTVEMANAIFTKFKLEQQFLNLIKNYKATIDNVVSAEQGNTWCSNATHNKIPTIVNDINGVLMILINVIYFKGNWQKTFDVKLTNKQSFLNFNKEEKITDFMHMTNNFYYFESQKIQAIQINYEKDNLKAFIILPKIERDINAYIKNFTIDKYSEIVKKMQNKKVILSMPKFEINFEDELKAILISMGMKEAFGQADFSVMRKKKDIQISKVIHKTFIKVDEKGTVAAAVTAVVMRKVYALPKETTPEMIINHPFLFIIRSDDLPYGHDILFFSKVEAL